MTPILWIAAAPAVIMLIYVYNKDTIEKEPRGLLALLIFGGCLAVIPAVMLEKIGGMILESVFSYYSVGYVLADNFLVVALSEEISKFFFLWLFSWKKKCFDYLFDGMIYAVCVAIGFSVLEDIMYMVSFGIGTGAARALTFIPGHFGFAVFSGALYSIARMHSNYGNRSMCTLYIIAAIVCPVLLHGFYDSCLSFESGIAYALFFAFVIIMYIAVFKMIRKMSRIDHPIN